MDTELRRAERNGDRVKYYSIMLRSGQINEKVLRALAYCGDKDAAQVCGYAEFSDHIAGICHCADCNFEQSLNTWLKYLAYYINKDVMVGLIEAVRFYHPDRSTCFTYYCKPCKLLRKVIEEEIRESLSPDGGMADARDLKSLDENRAGSNPAPGI